MFADSLASLDEQQTAAVAADPGGAHVLEAFIEGAAAAGIKKRVLEKLTTRFAEVCGGVASVWVLLGLKGVSTSRVSPPGQPTRSTLNIIWGRRQVATAGGFGIRCVETCYKWADLPLKETIAAELVPIEKELANSRTGGYLLQRCGLSELKCALNRPPRVRQPGLLFSPGAL